MTPGRSASLKFIGKTLLVLGSNSAATNIVKYAVDNGAHVIVTDYYPKKKSPAKQLASESLDISTVDIESLCEVVRTKDVDAVLSGISEVNILSAMEISRRCDLPFYCTRAQWDSVENKASFRDLCNRYGVPCPATYCVASSAAAVPWEKITYPAIVKPVDESSSIGVHICANEQELRDGVLDALSLSDLGSVIVEAFCSGYEFTAHYTVKNGVPKLACIDNRYPVALHEGAVTTIPIARVFPSLFIDDFIEKVDPGLTSMVASLGLNNAVLFVQGLFDPEEGRFNIFEGGLRSAAECPFRFIETVNGLNYIKLLVDTALLGSAPDYNHELEDPYLSNKVCGIISFAGKHGVVESISGLEKRYPGVIETELRYPVGTEIPDTDTLRQLAVRFVMVAETRDDLAAHIDEINKAVSIEDSNGNSLIVPFESSRLKSYK